MLFVDFFGPAEVFARTQRAIQEQVGRVFHTGEIGVVVRRFEVDEPRPEVEVWIEVSSEEQIYRFGRRIAAEISRVVRDQFDMDVWVMFRVVPLAHAFLNGEPRARGVEAFE